MNPQPNRGKSNPDPGETWPTSKSKALLRSGLLSGLITAEMLPRAVFDLNPVEHSKWNYTNWSSNLGNLREAIDRDRSRMQRDAISYGHDLAIVKAGRSPTAKIPWHRSLAPPLLKQDVNDGRHKEMTPKELYGSRPEYSTGFTLEEFRKHIYQEVDSWPKRAIRFEKKKKAWRYPELHADHPRLQEDEEDS
jgi:hypothetical protein